MIFMLINYKWSCGSGIVNTLVQAGAYQGLKGGRANKNLIYISPPTPIPLKYLECEKNLQNYPPPFYHCIPPSGLAN